MFDFLKPFKKKEEKKTFPAVNLDNKKYMTEKEIPTEVETTGYYNSGFIELEDGRKGWMLIPMTKYTPEKYRN